MFKYVLLIIFITNPAWSFNLDEALEKLDNNHEKKKHLSIDHIIDDLGHKAHNEVNKIKGKITEFESKLSSEVDKIKGKIANTISDFDHKIKEIEDLKNRVIFWGKVLAGSFIVIFLLLFFFIFKLFRKCNNIINIINNVSNYDDVIKRIKALENAK